MPTRTDLLTIQKGSTANRYSCIAHAAAGQTQRHVEMKDGKRRRERQGRVKTRGRPSPGWVSFFVSKWTEAIPGVSGAGDTFWQWGGLRCITPGTTWERRREQRLHRVSFWPYSLFYTSGLRPCTWTGLNPGRQTRCGMNPLSALSWLVRGGMVKTFKDRLESSCLVE